MAEGLKPIRRVVTGNDEQGRSRVVWDGPAPNVVPTLPGRGVTNLWVYYEVPAPLSGDHDDGNLPYNFPGPPKGGHLRVVHSRGKPADYDPANDPELVPPHEPRERPEGRTWDRGGANAYSVNNHKTETIDYGIVLEGERVLTLDDGSELVMRPGDIVIQIGAWHGWSSPRMGSLMAFDMIAAAFDDPLGMPRKRDTSVVRREVPKLPEGVKPARRILTADLEPGRSSLVSDGPAPDVRIDPARPGFASQRLWVTDSTPAKLVLETVHLPHTIEPPPSGSVCRVVTFPPDDVWRGKVGATEVRAFFQAMGSPGASTYSPQAPHPYMQKTRSLDFCLVLEGEIALVLDTQEVDLKAGDVVIQRGTNHAWSNRSNQPAVIAICSHDGKY